LNKQQGSSEFRCAECLATLRCATNSKAYTSPCTARRCRKRPLWVKSGLSSQHHSMTAFPPKADNRSRSMLHSTRQKCRCSEPGPLLSFFRCSSFLQGRKRLQRPWFSAVFLQCSTMPFQRPKRCPQSISRASNRLDRRGTTHGWAKTRVPNYQPCRCRRPGDVPTATGASAGGRRRL